MRCDGTISDPLSIMSYRSFQKCIKIDGQFGYVILRSGLRGLLSRVGFASTMDYRCAASVPLPVLTHY